MKAFVLFLALFLIARVAAGQTESLPVHEGINAAILAPDLEGES